MNPPKFFSGIAASAVKRWEQLDADAVLKAPWVQLFAQVQSPRHVLSELLQNADDAGAKSARVRVLNNEFVFEHDGEDFSEEQLQSLCRFGFSNKRNLHTIGFRGIGFKSTFSLGRSVRIQTPTLDIVFERERFTLPIWNRSASGTQSTRITVPIADKPRLAQLRKNFEDWATSPASLLFFRNLRELTVESQTLRKQVIAPGPVKGSERIRLVGSKTEELLLIRSDEEAFPADAVDEIRQERNADDLHLPPCHVDIVLGMDGPQRLFVVLPTGAEVALPFCINAPFIQDPGRFLIKEPEVSPCNRWLLERAGELAARALAQWLATERLSMAERAEAYSLLRRPVADGADLKTSTTKQVMDSMLEVLEEKPILLNTDGKLSAVGECVALPAGLHKVWEPKQLAPLFAGAERKLLAPEATDEAGDVLEAHGWIEKVTPESALESLTRDQQFPKPASWSKLQLLWEWVERHIGWDYGGERRRTMRIVPAEGESTLHAADDLIRVSSRRDQLSDADWKFISNFALAVDREWLAHLAKLKSANSDDDPHPALGLLEEIGLDEPSLVDRIAEQASRRLRSQGELQLADCVRIAHIFAALDATVPDDFWYITEDLHVRDVSEHPVVIDADARVESLVPKSWAASHLLHSDYCESFTSCRRDQWFGWAYSSKSKLNAFVPLVSERKQFWGRSELQSLLTERDGQKPTEFKYKNNNFIFDDIDFPAAVTTHWRQQAKTDPEIWAKVVKGLLLAPLSSWQDALEISIRQVSTQGSTFLLNCGTVLPAWLRHLRGLPCLYDTQGHVRPAPELLLRTANTEQLMGIESFVAPELDDSEDKKELLRLLGVRETGIAWEKVVDRLRGLSKIKDATRVLGDILRLYSVLDLIAVRCPTEQMGKLKAMFASEGLILSNSLEWLSAVELSLHADPEDNFPVVHSAAQSLALWLRVGVPERPALEKSLEWLKTLAPGTRLDGAAYKRANVALSRAGRRVWEELGHWLSLDQTWAPTASLQYRVSMRSLTRWEKLSIPTKRATADLRMVVGDAADQPPFTAVRNLSEVISMRVTNVRPISGRQRRIDWLRPLADGLCRVKLLDAVATAKVREVARRLLQTKFQTVSLLEVTPYIDGVPAGEPLRPNVLWSEIDLFVADQSTVKLYRELKEELGRPFGEASVMEAIAHCIDRDADFVREYLAANFELDAQAELPPENERTDSEKKNADDRDATPTSEEQAEETDEQPQEAESNEEENADDGEPEPGNEQGEEEPEGKPEKPKQPKEPTFMDRYAKSRGFRWRDDERCYTHANGSWIERGEAPFSWHEHADGTGVTKRLFVAEETLSRGIEIPAELWRMLDINPDSISFVLCAEDGSPNEWHATELKELHTIGEIQLHQSRFILKQQPN